MHYRGGEQRQSQSYSQRCTDGNADGRLPSSPPITAPVQPPTPYRWAERGIPSAESMAAFASPGSHLFSIQPFLHPRRRVLLNGVQQLINV